MKKSSSNPIYFILAALILAITGIGGCIALQQIFGSKNVSRIATNPQVQNRVKEEFVLSDFKNIHGTPYLITSISLKSKNNRDYEYEDKAKQGIRNLIFLNTNDLSERRLMPKNNFVFLDYKELSENPDSDKSNPPNPTNVKALWYRVVSNDSNNDGVFNYKDKQTIAFSDTSGANYTEVIKNIDGFFQAYRKDKTNILFIYNSGGKRLVSEVNILSRQITKTKELTSIE